MNQQCSRIAQTKWSNTIKLSQLMGMCASQVDNSMTNNGGEEEDEFEFT
jgi:hypothetical protein